MKEPNSITINAIDSERATMNLKLKRTLKKFLFNLFIIDLLIITDY